MKQKKTSTVKINKTNTEKRWENPKKEETEGKKIEIAAGEKEKLFAFLITFRAMLHDLSPNGQLAFICFLESNFSELWKKKIDFIKE